MTKLYRKSELIFALVWIGIYCVFMSVGDELSLKTGIKCSVSLPVSALLSMILLIFFKKSSLLNKYGLCKSEVPPRKMLFYIPLLLIIAVNLLGGFGSGLTVTETVLSVLTMLFVGFLEEVIFRGLLFKAMAKENIKTAVIVSSITFGIGHIMNLFNSSDAEFIPNILQVIYATAAGFMFVMIYLKTKSLVPCIITHSVFNGIGVFCNENALTMAHRLVSCTALVIISSFYAIYLFLSTKKIAKE